MSKVTVHLEADDGSIVTYHYPNVTTVEHSHVPEYRLAEQYSFVDISTSDVIAIHATFKIHAKQEPEDAEELLIEGLRSTYAAWWGHDQPPSMGWTPEIRTTP